MRHQQAKDSGPVMRGFESIKLWNIYFMVHMNVSTFCNVVKELNYTRRK